MSGECLIITSIFLDYIFSPPSVFWSYWSKVHMSTVNWSDNSISPIGLISHSVIGLQVYVTINTFNRSDNKISPIGMICLALLVYIAALQWIGILFFWRLLILWIQLDWVTNSKPTFHKVSADSIPQAWHGVHCSEPINTQVQEASW